jgi:hypothetical protein
MPDPYRLWVNQERTLMVRQWLRSGVVEIAERDRPKDLWSHAEAAFMGPQPRRGSVLTVGSLFTGIGGFDLGLEPAGLGVVWQCGSNPFYRAQQDWPNVRCYNDAQELRGDELKPVRVVCGGVP